MNLADTAMAVDWEGLAGDVGLEPNALRDLLAGVAAASRAMPEGWGALFDPVPDAALQDRLEHALYTLQASRDPGFTVGPAPADRLTALRAELQRRGLDGFIVPRNDEFMGEYVPERADRLPWLTGFTGSAGTVVVGLEKAAIFVDGRYTLQVRDQVNTDLFDVHQIPEDPPTDWIAATFSTGQKLGFDPWLHTKHGTAHLERAAKKAGAELVRVDGNPIDAIWTGQPAAPISPALVQQDRFAGESAAEKRRRLADALAEDGLDAAVITATDSVAWLLNVRGSDVPNCPLSLSFAILRADATVDWFVDARKVTRGVRQALGNGVAVTPIERFAEALDSLGKAGMTVQADPASSPAFVLERLASAGASLKEGDDPCLLPKACKNPVELDGTRAAHIRDGQALVRFLRWVSETVPGGQVTELEAIAKLRALRGEGTHFRGVSFDTIAGSGPNGAIVHYRASEQTDRVIQDGELLLVDSGGQYFDGTTDVTRTMAIGAPTAEMRRNFTLVLKGHIAIATARFPAGVTGSQLDPFARAALWRAGLDYDHGTGHGVGSYLNVHEGPQRIAKAHNAVALQPGMILSNEPGYYKAGEYGIRIENLVVVQPVDEPPEGAEKALLQFETITLAPIDGALVDPSLLSRDEVDWLNAYHDRVRETLSDGLDAASRKWLDDATSAISG